MVTLYFRVTSRRHLKFSLHDLKVYHTALRFTSVKILRGIAEVTISILENTLSLSPNTLNLPKC